MTNALFFRGLHQGIGVNFGALAALPTRVLERGENSGCASAGARVHAEGQR
jgi:hypothetical protein